MEYCGTCRYYERAEKNGDWICVNPDSDNFADYPGYEDHCEEYKERHGE